MIQLREITHPSTTIMEGEHVCKDGLYEYMYYSQFSLVNFAIYHGGMIRFEDPYTKLYGGC